VIPVGEGWPKSFRQEGVVDQTRNPQLFWWHGGKKLVFRLGGRHDGTLEATGDKE
jgi:hypothetical protein